MAFDWNSYLESFKQRVPEDLKPWVGKGVSTTSLLGHGPLDTREPFSWLGQANTGFDIRDNSVFTYKDYNDPKFKGALDAWVIDQTLKAQGLSTPGSYYWNRMQAGPPPGANPLLTIAAGLATAPLGGIGAGIASGIVGGMSSYTGDSVLGALESGAKGGAIGGGMGYLGGKVGEGLSSLTSGYKPEIADSIWSTEATVNPLVSTGMQYASTPLMNISKKQITDEINNSLFSNLQNKNQGNLGGNMAIGDMTLGSLAQGVAPFLSAYQGYRNLGAGQDAYNRAIDLIQTPSPDQAKYRGMLSDLMTRPGSFYESPVYQAMAEQGRNALERSQSARGILGSGGAAAELQKLGMQSAAQYYYPQAQMLSSLSGVTGDQAARALAAQGVLGAEGSRQAGQSAMLNELMKGIGYKSPEEQMAQTIFGGGQGGLGGTTLGTIGNTLKDWFSSSTPSNYDFSSPVFTDNLSWENLTSGPSAGVDYSNYMGDLSPIDYSNLAGSQQDYLNWFM